MGILITLVMENPNQVSYRTRTRFWVIHQQFWNQMHRSRRCLRSSHHISPIEHSISSSPQPNAFSRRAASILPRPTFHYCFGRRIGTARQNAKRSSRREMRMNACLEEK